MLRTRWLSRMPLASLLFRRAAVEPGAFVQHVRIKNRRRLRNVAIGATVLYACWSTYLTRIVLPPIIKHIDEDGQPIFLPFPFTSKVVESRPYKGSDPEWQEYVRIAQDRKLLLGIQRDLLQVVQNAAVSNPVIVQKCGRYLYVRRHWLDVEFPYRPPPKVMREGLLVSQEGLELVTMEVDPTTVMRISRALWPAPVAQSAPAFVSTLFRQNMQNVARYFGFEVPEPTPMNTLASVLKKRLEEAERRAANQSGPNFDETDSAATTHTPTPNPAARQVASGTNGLSTTSATTTTTTSASTSTPVEGTGTDKPANARDMIPFHSLRPSIDNAWLEFKKKLSQTWRPLRPQPPPGCVGLSGVVELVSNNSRVLIDVSAHWDPKTRKYDSQTMHLKLRSIRLRKQLSE